MIRKTFAGCIAVLLSVLFVAWAYGQSGLNGGIVGPHGIGGTATSSGCISAAPTATAGPNAIIGSATTCINSSSAPAVQLATTATAGLVQPDGSSIIIQNGIISATATGVISVSSGCGNSTFGGAITAGQSGIISTIVTPFPFTSNASSPFGVSNCGNLTLYLSATSDLQPSFGGAQTTDYPTGFFWDHCNYTSNAQTLSPTTNYIGSAGATRRTYQLLAGTATSPTCVRLVSNNDASGNVGNWDVEWATGGLLANSSQTATSYTFANGDCSTEKIFTNSSIATATIPITLPAGCKIEVIQAGAGRVAVNGSATTAVTLHNRQNFTGTAGQWAKIVLDVYTAGVAILSGDGS